MSMPVGLWVRMSAYKHISGNTGPNFTDFYRAMLCIRGTSHGPVSVCPCLSVRLSQVGVLLKRVNVVPQKQHLTIA